MICSKCDKKHEARGLCKSHYQKMWKLENPEKYREYRIREKEKIKLARAEAGPRVIRPTSRHGNAEWYKLLLEDYKWRKQRQ